MFFIRLAFASTILASLTFCVFWASRLGTKATEHTPTKTPTNVPTNLPTNIPTKTPTNVPTVPIFVCTRTIGSAMFMKDWLYWYASQGVDRITLLVDARNISDYLDVSSAFGDLVHVKSAPFGGRRRDEKRSVSECAQKVISGAVKTTVLFVVDDDEYVVPNGNKTIRGVFSGNVLQVHSCKCAPILMFGTGGQQRVDDLVVRQFTWRKRHKFGNNCPHPYYRTYYVVNNQSKISKIDHHRSRTCENVYSEDFVVHHYTRGKEDIERRVRTNWRGSSTFGNETAHTEYLKQYDKATVLDQRAVKFARHQEEWMEKHLNL